MTLSRQVLAAFLLLASVTANACDCAHFAYEALKRIQIKLSTVPAIVGTLGRNGYSRGVAYIHFPATCNVYVHEFAHHDQWLRGLEAGHAGDAMWWRLEDNAAAIEKRAMEYPPQCLEDDQ